MLTYQHGREKNFYLWGPDKLKFSSLARNMELVMDVKCMKYCRITRWKMIIWFILENLVDSREASSPSFSNETLNDHFVRKCPAFRFACCYWNLDFGWFTNISFVNKIDLDEFWTPQTSGEILQRKSWGRRIFPKLNLMVGKKGKKCFIVRFFGSSVHDQPGRRMLCLLF